MPDCTIPNAGFHWKAHVAAGFVGALALGTIVFPDLFFGNSGFVVGEHGFWSGAAARQC